MPDIALERGLPHNLDAERFVLGAILQDDTRFTALSAALPPDDFYLEKHRRIFARMRDLHERSERIDRVTLANELMAQRQLESCDGLGYLVSLDEGLPELPKFESYIRIVREKGRLRELIRIGQRLIDSALIDDGTPAHELASAVSERLSQIGASDKENKLVSVFDIIRNHDGGLVTFLSDIGEGTGIQTGFLRLDQMTGGLQRGDLVVLAARPSMGKTALALNIAAHAAMGEQRLESAYYDLDGKKLCQWKGQPMRPQLLKAIVLSGLAAVPSSAASIRVVATSNIGNALEPEIHLYQAGTHKDFWPAGRQQSASNIPPGYYQIDVFSFGFRRYKQELEVGANRTDIRAVLTPSGGAMGELDLSGKVINAKSYEGLWALAFPLAGNVADSTQSMVSSSGTFRIATAHPGPYILVLVRGDSTLGCKQVYIGASNPDIQISAAE